MKKIKRVLLIDDDEATNFLNKVILSRSQKAEEILPFQKAEEALKYLENTSENEIPELIFLDINMPLMDGWEFMKRYTRLDNSKKKSVIVMLTSSINPDDKSRALAIKEISDYKTKPLSHTSLNEIINKFFH